MYVCHSQYVRLAQLRVECRSWIIVNNVSIFEKFKEDLRINQNDISHFMKHCVRRKRDMNVDVSSGMFSVLHLKVGRWRHRY